MLFLVQQGFSSSHVSEQVLMKHFPTPWILQQVSSCPRPLDPLVRVGPSETEQLRVDGFGNPTP